MEFSVLFGTPAILCRQNAAPPWMYTGMPRELRLLRRIFYTEVQRRLKILRNELLFESIAGGKRNDPITDQPTSWNRKEGDSHNKSVQSAFFSVRDERGMPITD